MAATITLRTRAAALRTCSGDAAPLLRGRIHQLCALASLPAGLHLLSEAGGLSSSLAVGVYALTLAAMFTTSAVYHRLPCAPAWKHRLRRADHSMIFVHIAGAYTPLCVLTIPTAAAVVSLGLVWSGALGGVVVKLGRELSDHGSGGSRLYLPLGWTATATIPLMVPSLGPRGTALLLASGLAYSAGALCFFRKSPDPLPAVFGYHEVWHLFTLVGAVCQYLVVIELVGG